MGITVVPKERDETTDLSRLEIKFNRGTVITPSRFITKVDLNAKDGIGADVPLSRTRKLFLYEEFVNPNTIDNILHKNGYLATYLTNYQNFIGRVERSDALRLVYPKFTKDGGKVMDGIGDSSKNKVWSFFFNVMLELSQGKNTIDGFFVQQDCLTANAKKYLISQPLPFIPVIDIQGDYRVVQKQLTDYSTMSSSLVPFIGIGYSTLTQSNLAYQEAISMLDTLHESGKGFITVDSPRAVGKGLEDPDVSALHYSNFVVADLTAERPYGGGKGEPHIRLFEKGDLAVPLLQEGHNSIEHSDEANFLENDPKLKLLMQKMFDGNVDQSEKGRAGYLSRVHENIMTGSEYEKMQKSLMSNELLRYRMEKQRINRVLEGEGR